MKYVIYRRFAKVVQKPVYNRVSKLLAHAGIEEEAELWVGARLLIAILFAGVGALMPFSIVRLLGLYQFEFTSLTLQQGVLLAGLSVLFGGAFFLGTLGIVYIHLYYLINDRTRRVEGVLPDFLMMVSANLRAGMTPYSAFQVSARPEFGPLEHEIKIVASKSLGTESFTDALRELNNRIDSGLLRRTISFFEEGLKSGGKLANLLETTADEIREMEELRKELLLSTKTYTIFLIFILLVGLPLLLAISTQFLITFSKIQGDVGSSVSQISLFTAPKINVSADFITNMALILIIGTSLLTSIMIGVISDGKLLFGVKYFIPLAGAAVVMFMAFQFVLAGFLAQIL